MVVVGGKIWNGLRDDDEGGLDTELAVMLQKSRIQWYRSRLPLGKVVDKSGKAAIVWQAGEE